MAAPSPQLLEQLATSRFLTQAEASVGSGERRSSVVGSGLEFEGHRPYNDGDDSRHIDARLLARLDEHHVRLFALERQLPITILIDGSASMSHGTPDKFSTAITLAQLLVFVGLSGGDRVEMAVFADGKLDWSPRLTGLGRLEWAFDWLAGHAPRGGSPIGEGVRAVAPRLPASSKLILISDWWDEQALAALEAVGLAGHEMLALHLLAPEEIDPPQTDQGRLHLRDIETRDDLDLAVDAGTVGAYRSLLAEWRDGLRRSLARFQGRYFPISSAISPEHFLLRDLRGAGVIS
jgi:uncharacterized protein (DUF58 family)